MNQIPQRMEVFMKMVSCSDLEEIYWHELDALLSWISVEIYASMYLMHFKCELIAFIRSHSCLGRDFQVRKIGYDNSNVLLNSKLFSQILGVRMTVIPWIIVTLLLHLKRDAKFKWQPNFRNS